MAAAQPSNTKQIRIITGGAAAAAAAAPTSLEEGEEGAAATTRKARRGGGKKSKTFKLGHLVKEGGAASPGTIVQMSATHIPGAAGVAAAPSPPAPVGVNSAATQKGAPIGGAPAAAAAPPQKPDVKVVLAAPKKKKGKVVLAAAAAPKPAVAAKVAPKTRKARKIKVSMKALSKKIHRAKTIRHKATEDSLDTVKKTLHKAGLVKADTKAPDAILRQMYADYMTLKNRAL